MGTAIWGTEVIQRGPGAEPRWRSGCFALRSQICIICSGQTHFRDVFTEDIRCTTRLMQSLPSPTPTPPKKLFEFVQISRPTLAEVRWARAHQYPTVATPLFAGRIGRVGGPPVGQRCPRSGNEERSVVWTARGLNPEENKVESCNVKQAEVE